MIKATAQAIKYYRTLNNFEPLPDDSIRCKVCKVIITGAEVKQYAKEHPDEGLIQMQIRQTKEHAHGNPILEAGPW